MIPNAFESLVAALRASLAPPRTADAPLAPAGGGPETPFDELLAVSLAVVVLPSEPVPDATVPILSDAAAPSSAEPEFVAAPLTEKTRAAAPIVADAFASAAAPRAGAPDATVLDPTRDSDYGAMHRVLEQPAPVPPPTRAPTPPQRVLEVEAPGRGEAPVATGEKIGPAVAALEADAGGLRPSAAEPHRESPAPAPAPAARGAADEEPDASAADPRGGQEKDDRSASQRRGGTELPIFARHAVNESTGAIAPSVPAAGTDATAPVTPATPASTVAAEVAIDPPPAPVASTPATATAEPRSAPGAASPPSADALATRIEWLAERGGGTVRVRLDPPSLGEIEIEVRLRNGVAEVVVHTRESDTQALLVGERTAVTQILAARDVRMDDFQVVHQAPPRGDAAASGATGDQTSQRDASARGDAQGGGEGRRDSPPQPGAGDGRAPAPRAFTPPALESTRLDLRV